MDVIVRISRDHPSLPGHFPGNPVVPGVVLLDEVLAALPRFVPHARVVALSAVKFVSPLRPEQDCRVRFTRADAGAVKFECHVGAQAIASGVVRTVA